MTVAAATLENPETPETSLVPEGAAGCEIFAVLVSRVVVTNMVGPVHERLSRHCSCRGQSFSAACVVVAAVMLVVVVMIVVARLVFARPSGGCWLHELTTDPL